MALTSLLFERTSLWLLFNPIPHKAQHKHFQMNNYQSSSYAICKSLRKSQLESFKKKNTKMKSHVKFKFIVLKMFDFDICRQRVTVERAVSESEFKMSGAFLRCGLKERFENAVIRGRESLGNKAHPRNSEVCDKRVDDSSWMDFSIRIRFLFFKQNQILRPECSFMANDALHRSSVRPKRTTDVGIKRHFLATCLLVLKQWTAKFSQAIGFIASYSTHSRRRASHSWNASPNDSIFRIRIPGLSQDQRIEFRCDGLNWARDDGLFNSTERWEFLRTPWTASEWELIHHLLLNRRFRFLPD